jgi:hypothetical protein
MEGTPGPNVRLRSGPDDAKRPADDNNDRRSYARSKRSRFMTLFHAATKSFTKASFESLEA